jgi:hypothetical protein
MRHTVSNTDGHSYGDPYADSHADSLTECDEHTYSDANGGRYAIGPVHFDIILR